MRMNSQLRHAFTLIELLVVIAIIAILAAILFPVFAQAKLAAKKTQDLSNIKQIGLSTMMYLNDNDDVLYSHRDNCKSGSSFIVCPQYLDGNGNIIPDAQGLVAPGDTGTIGASPALGRYFYMYKLQPYVKNYDLFKNPANMVAPFTANSLSNQHGPYTAAGTTGYDYGSQNSYGHNDSYLSPAAPFGGSGTTPAAVAYGSIPRVAGTIMLVDATYYGAAFDPTNESGLTNFSHCVDVTDCNLEAQAVSFNGASNFYLNYWANIGGGNWSYSGGPALDSNGPISQGFVNAGKQLFNGKVNVQWTDGHAKSLQYASVVGDVCYWSTDIEGAHPNCSN
jgi:prepilin-type N-terminal cleavage/methylation domain-containing protein/prepilin-type processing-associated H-X9-DG protein